MNGILCIHKPADFTSFDVIAKMRGIVGERKMGHAGTLDPMATGVLPVFLGGATKAISLMEDHTKEYRATLRLGITTDTQDIWGKPISEKEVSVSKEQVLAAAKTFCGTLRQIPPMMSAVQINGKRLYDLARKGIEVERAPREITVFRFDFVEADEETNAYTFDISCSQGTYIRTLCADLGEKLGCGACMTSLLRTRSCTFTLADCVTLEELQEIRNNGGIFPVLPVKRAFENLPDVTVSEAQAVRFANGGELAAARVQGLKQEGDYCVLSPDGTFLGIGSLHDESLFVRKLFVIRKETMI